MPTGEKKSEAPQTGASSHSRSGPVLQYGYLTITVDMTTATAPVLTIAFTAPDDLGAADQISVTLT